MNASRWHTLEKRIQLLSIMAELERARTWESQRGAQFIGALERALDLVDFTIGDPRWRGETLQLFALRDEIAKHYANLTHESIAALSRAL